MQNMYSIEFVFLIFNFAKPVTKRRGEPIETLPKAQFSLCTQLYQFHDNLNIFMQTGSYLDRQTE